jgi:hypothetical protein
MQLVDLRKPGEKKKLISAAVLGLVAIVFLWWTLIGFDSGTATVSRPTPSPSPRGPQATRSNDIATPAVTELADFTEIVYQSSSYNAPQAKRNIFAYWEPPVKTEAAPVTPTPTPEPPPPILLASVSPSNVYARTEDFKLELAGDRFSREVRIFVDGREMPTSYQSPQQLSTVVPAAMIVTPGARNVVVRTPDEKLFSAALQINVAEPPKPNYNYIGIIGQQSRVGDVALVQDKNNKSMISVYRGDVLGGRFRVTSISDKELVVTDTTLKIKHVMAMSEGDKGGGPLSRPTPRVDAEDDEP